MPGSSSPSSASRSCAVTRAAMAGKCSRFCTAWRTSGPRPVLRAVRERGIAARFCTRAGHGRIRGGNGTHDLQEPLGIDPDRLGHAVEQQFAVGGRPAHAPAAAAPRPRNAPCRRHGRCRWSRPGASPDIPTAAARWHTAPRRQTGLPCPPGCPGLRRRAGTGISARGRRWPRGRAFCSARQAAARPALSPSKQKMISLTSRKARFRCSGVVDVPSVATA